MGTDRSPGSWYWAGMVGGDCGAAGQKSVGAAGATDPVTAVAAVGAAAAVGPVGGAKSVDGVGPAAGVVSSVMVCPLADRLVRLEQIELPGNELGDGGHVERRGARTH